MIKTLLILRKRTDRKITRQLRFLVCYNLQGRQEEDAKRQNIRSETIAKGDRGLFAPSPTKGSFIGVLSFSGFLLEKKARRGSPGETKERREARLSTYEGEHLELKHELAFTVKKEILT